MIMYPVTVIARMCNSFDCPSFLLSLPTSCTMYYIGCLSLSGHNIVLLRWSVLRCAPSYLCDLCCPVSVLAAHRVLCSASFWFGPSGPFSYCAATGHFGCGPVGME